MVGRILVALVAVLLVTGCRASSTGPKTVHLVGQVVREIAIHRLAEETRKPRADYSRPRRRVKGVRR